MCPATKRTRRDSPRLIGFIAVSLALVWSATDSVAGQRAGAPKGSEYKVDAQVAPPKILAVRVRHDLCPFCQRFDPQMPKLVRDSSQESILWVTLDLSTESSQRQAAMLVSALQLEQVWTGDLSKMGSITFLDGKTREVLSFVQAADAKKVRKAIKDITSTE